ncbi:unnamed protein product [Absidia cylindrospora]
MLPLISRQTGIPRQLVRSSLYTSARRLASSASQESAPSPPSSLSSKPAVIQEWEQEKQLIPSIIMTISH